MIIFHFPYKSRIHSIVDQILPLLTDKNVTNVINDLPKGIRLIAAIIDTLSIPSVQRLLEDGFPLRSMLRPSGWKHVQQELNRLESSLVPFYPDMNLVIEHSSSWDDHNNQSTQKDSKGRTYDILVNAHLNLMRFGIHSDSGSHQSFRSFRDVICDHNELEKFLITPNRRHSSDDIRFLSRHLCLLERKDLYYLFDLVQDNIDFVSILQQLSLVFHSVGLDEHQQHLNNIRSMITTIDQANIFPSMTALRNTSWLYDLPSLFDVLRSGEIDVHTLLKIINDIEPIFGGHNHENEQLTNQQQNQRIEYLMRLYDSDDSTLKTIAHSTIGSISKDETIDSFDDDYSFDDEDELISLTNDTNIRAEHKEMTILHSIDDLDTSETANVNLLSIAATNYPTDSLGRRFLPKLLANMDKFIDGAEKFTRTPQWNSLLNAFQGLQMMLEMTDSNGQQQFSSTNIEQFIINFPKNIQALTNFFNSIVPEKFQPLVLPLFNLVQRIADSMLQHLSGAFTRALNEDKIYYFDKLVQLLIASMNNGTLPRKCFDMQHAMCDFDQFQSVFIQNIDDETGEVIVMVDEDIGTLQGIQELGCIFFGQNYLRKNVEESTPILAKLYYTLSALNDTNQLSSSLAELSNSTGKSSTDDDAVFWNNFTTRMLEVYLLATKSVNSNTWSAMMGQMSYVWKRNRLFDRIILASRVLQLTANCFTPERIMNSPIWFHIQRKNIIINEILNLVMDEINQAVENEELRVQQLSMGSPTLHKFLHKNLHLLPILMDSVFDTLFLNLPRFVERMFQLSNTFMANWPCNRFSLVDLLAIQNEQHRSEIHQVEDFLCRQYHMNEGDYGRVIDELVSPNNNQSRGAPLIRVLQNKSNNLSMIYEHVPPLDWVEAAHSVSMIKESAEKLIFADNNWIWFPEVDKLDTSIRNSFGRARLVFQQFYSQGMAGLFTYVGDIITPFAIRYMSLNETFSQICDYGVSGILMAPVVNDKEWRCFFVSSKFASYSLQHLLELLNQVLTNFLHDDNQCRIFDVDNGIKSSNDSHNQILFLSDHMAEIIELVMNQLLLGDMNRLSNATSLQDVICHSSINIDVFNENHRLYSDIRHALCGLPNQFANCFRLTMPEKWIEASDHLNFTWYTQSLAELSNKSSFVDAYRSIYRFLTLFGQFSPRFMNRLLSRFESNNHGQQFVNDVLKRMNRMQRFREKRFTYVMQSISLELHRILFTTSKVSHVPIHREEKRDLMMALIYALNELPIRLRQRYKLGGIHYRPTMSNNSHNNNDDDIHLQVDLLDSLLDWIDSHLLTITDILLQTITLDRQRLNRLFINKFDTVSVWRAFCRAPISQYFIVDNEISSLSH
ncbi:ABC transporter sub-family A-like protein, partial [Euroglyphus maynei]